MNRFLVLFAVVVLLINNSNGKIYTIKYFTKLFEFVITLGHCEIDPYDKSITVHNLRNNCNSRQLLSIFTNLTAGPFPPEGSLKGYVLQCFGKSLAGHIHVKLSSGMPMFTTLHKKRYSAR